MARFTVKWTPHARIERRQILLYWKIRNKSNVFPKQLSFEIKTELNRTANNLTLAKKINDELFYTRVRAYKMVFKISNNSIVVLTIFDSRQNPNKLSNQIES